MTPTNEAGAGRHGIRVSRDSQWKRYVSRFGEIAVSRIRRNVIGFIPAHTPVISLSLSRNKAASGLREWRRP